MKNYLNITWINVTYPDFYNSSTVYPLWLLPIWTLHTFVFRTTSIKCRAYCRHRLLPLLVTAAEMPYRIPAPRSASAKPSRVSSVTPQLPSLLLRNLSIMTSLCPTGMAQWSIFPIWTYHSPASPPVLRPLSCEPIPLSPPLELVSRLTDWQNFRPLQWPLNRIFKPRRCSPTSLLLIELSRCL